MAKNRKFSPEQDTQAPVMTEQPTTEQPTTEAPKNGLGLVKKPSIHLLESGVTQMHFTRFPMIKRATKLPDGDFKVSLDDVETPVWATSSKGWAAEDASIDYVWFILPDGTTGYVTLDYNVEAGTFANAAFELKDGKADRADPKRTPKNPDTEAHRIAQFQAAMEAKKQPATTEGEQPTTEAAA